MKLIETVSAAVKSALPYDKTNVALQGYLESCDAHKLLVIYLNWRTRWILATPRRVHVSRTLQGKMVSSPHREVIDQIIQDIEQGTNLQRYLSEGVTKAVAMPKPGKLSKRADLDLLLTTWELHHLHLSVVTRPNGFVTRTRDLLFGVFRNADAYLVDIQPHGNWYEEDFLRILLNELPKSNVVHEIRGAVAVSPLPSREDIKQLRNAGVNTAHMVDGKPVIAIGGLTSAGTGIDATQAADEVIGRIEKFEVDWVSNPEAVRRLYLSAGVTLPAAPVFRFYISPDEAGVYESTTSALYPF